MDDSTFIAATVVLYCDNFWNEFIIVWSCFSLLLKVMCVA